MNAALLPAEQAPPPEAPRGPRLPLSRPRVTYLLLALIGLAFVVEVVFGGSQSLQVLYVLGAQWNPAVAAGELWRLGASMFLHIGITHLAFNGWALYSIGRDVEAFYGAAWFTVIYLFSGLAGNVAYYWLGGEVLSAGASGAIFGLIGAEVALFASNRALFGRFGRERLMNLLFLIAINVFFGFSVPGINNIAHLGGLAAGLGLGLVLTPRYAVSMGPRDLFGTGSLAIADRRTLAARLLGIIVAVALLFGVLRLGDRRWSDGADPGQQAATAASEGPAPPESRARPADGA